MGQSSVSLSENTGHAHVRSLPAAFENAEAVDEIQHAVAVQGVVFSITDGAGRGIVRDVAALPEDVVDFESKYSGIVLEECFGDGSVPKPFFLFVSGGISGVSRVIDIAFDLKVVRKVERCGSSAAVVEGMQIVLSL